MATTVKLTGSPARTICATGATVTLTGSGTFTTAGALVSCPAMLETYTS